MTYEEWLEKLKKETGKTPEDLYNHTMEQIDIRPLYTEDDYKDMNHLHFMAGVPPYLRGPYPTMYVTRPWTVRQYAGFSTAPVHRLRLGDPPWLRLRPSPGGGRRGQGRRGRGLHPGYGDPL